MPLHGRNAAHDRPAAPTQQEGLWDKTQTRSADSICCSSRPHCWLKLSSQPGAADRVRDQQNKASLTCLVFMLHTASLVKPLLVTATEVPEAFQLALQVL